MVYEQLATKNLRLTTKMIYLCIFLPQVAMEGCDEQVSFYWVALTVEPTIANIFFCSPTFLLNTCFLGARF